MKLRKIFAMLLSFSLVSGTMATMVNASELMAEDPGVTVKAEVVAVDEYGPQIAITLTSDKFADPVMAGRKVNTVFGAAAVEVVLQLGDLFSTAGVDNNYMIEAPEGTTTFAGQTENKVFAAWANSNAAKFITNDTMQIVFAVDDADGAINTVEEYNANMGTVTSLFVTVKQYVDGSEAFITYVGTNADCKFEGTTVVGAGSTTVDPVAPVVTGVTIDPTTATVEGGAQATFTATVEGTDGNDETGAVVALDKSVKWTATAGTIADGVFTAPAATDAAQEITVTATSVADTTKSASATVTVPAKPVVAPVVESVTVDPATATVEGGATQQFTAVVSGTAGSDGTAVPQGVEWTATAGTIVDGLFTAPEATDAVQTITVTATAKGTEVKGTATVTVPAKDVEPSVEVVITAAKKTTNEAWLAAKGTTMYWGVTVTGEAAAADVKLTDNDEAGKTADLPVDLSKISGEGSKAFGVYVVLSESRLGHAIQIDATAGDGADSDVATYNNL